ncbi:MAG: Ni/Fe hydrogenase subunit alpha [bacterium]
MSKDVKIDVHYVTRVEGHGNIILNVRNGKIKELRFEIPESPRFFESMLRGRKYYEAPHITSRICGICSIGHTTASLRAAEGAVGIKPSEQTVLLRKLLLHGENMQSHILHVYFLAAPDFLGVGSVFPLVATHRDVVERALRLKKLANDLCDFVGGRTTHPITTTINGFTRLPDPKGLREMQKRLRDSIPDLEATVELFKTFDIPDFTRETEYISLKRDDEYAFYDGDIASTDGKRVPESRYREMTNEFVVPHSTAKHTKASRESFMVGALARFNNNSELLSPLAKKAASELGLKAPCYNPFMNNVAQLVEVVHSVEDSIRLIDEILDRGLKEEDRSARIRAGECAAAVEVPRGILYHHYEVNDDGTIVNANCIIPTNQNMNNIEHDMMELVPWLMERDKSQKEIQLGLEMLVRAYDPCISCSVHLIESK